MERCRHTSSIGVILNKNNTVICIEQMESYSQSRQLRELPVYASLIVYLGWFFVSLF